MNRIERRLRNLVNPYSTAFAGWWCHTARYLGPVRLVTGQRRITAGQRRRLAQPRATAPDEMARRRAALDATLARQAEPRED